MRCSRCQRPLRREAVYFWGNAYGPRCAQAVGGMKPRRRNARARDADERQPDLFAGARP